jgi:hypothetical protein
MHHHRICPSRETADAPPTPEISCRKAQSCRSRIELLVPDSAQKEIVAARRTMKLVAHE